jgi:hypothetical protein
MEYGLNSTDSSNYKKDVGYEQDDESWSGQ